LHDRKDAAERAKDFKILVKDLNDQNMESLKGEVLTNVVIACIPIAVYALSPVVFPEVDYTPAAFTTSITTGIASAGIKSFSSRIKRKHLAYAYYTKLNALRD
jgi:hypothetical protein